METINKKILVIDDEESICELIKDILTKEGFEVLIATNGNDGLNKVFKETPDLVIVDCVLPDIDGYTVVKKIREEQIFANLPIIMLTVKDTEQDEITGLNSGVDDYLTKPFRPAVLLTRIKTLIKRKLSSLSVNPLTFLPGNILIQAEVERRLNQKIPFVLLYIDISHFKSFNDRYGFALGDNVIKTTSKILLDTVKKFGNVDDFVGHIGGDDFVIITTEEKYKRISEEIIKLFDEIAPQFYDPQDRQKGFIVVENRQGVLQEFPIMMIRIVAVSTKRTKITHYAQISNIAAELKKYAKQFNKSILVEERRTE